MQVTTYTPNLLRERSEQRDANQGHVVSAADARARRSGGPQDEALYRCTCGYAFKAEVSTSVGCPHCGTDQAW
jgi:hypothetical protein